MREKEEGKGGERRKMQRRRRLTLPGRLTECARLPADSLEILSVSLLNLHFCGSDRQKGNRYCFQIVKSFMPTTCRSWNFCSPISVSFSLIRSSSKKNYEACAYD